MCVAISAAANSPNKAAVLPGPSWESATRVLVHRAGCGDTRIKFDLAKGAFVVGHVLVQNGRQRLGLLWTEANPLKISHLYLIVGLLLHGCEDQKKIPNVDPHLHAVVIGLAIFGGINYGEIRLAGTNHKKHSLARMRGEGNPGSGLRALGLRLQAL